jgi:hypothetical protein
MTPIETIKPIIWGQTWHIPWLEVQKGFSAFPGGRGKVFIRQ